jgi:hypothetical protein
MADVGLFATAQQASLRVDGPMLASARDRHWILDEVLRDDLVCGTDVVADRLPSLQQPAQPAPRKGLSDLDSSHLTV